MAENNIYIWMSVFKTQAVSLPATYKDNDFSVKDGE